MSPPKLDPSLLPKFEGLIGLNPDILPMSRLPFVSTTRVVPFFVSGGAGPLTWLRIAGLAPELAEVESISWEWRNLGSEFEKGRLEDGIVELSASPWGILSIQDESLQ